MLPAFSLGMSVGGSEPLVLTMTGKVVTGTFAGGKGTLSGTLEGKELKFKYKDMRFGRTGTGELVVSNDGKNIEGFSVMDGDPDATPINLHLTRLK